MEKKIRMNPTNGLQQSCRRGQADIAYSQEGTVYIRIDNVRHREQHAGFSGNLEEQSEVRIENPSDLQQRNNGQDRGDERDRNARHLLPFGCAVNRRSLVVFVIDADDSRHVHDRVVAHTPPSVDERQDIRPHFLREIPADRLDIQRGKKRPVHEAVLVTQEAEHQVRNDDHGQEVREEHDRLVQLRHEAALHLIKHEGNSKRDHKVQYDKQRVIRQRIARNNPGIRRLEQIGEVG